MRKFALAMFVVVAPMLSACDKQPVFNYTSADANEDAALNALESENNDAQGAGMAGAGLIPDQNGNLPQANVQ